MDQLGVPGVGLAFIDGGKVVWEGGLGVRELGKPQKVDAHTLFIAASNTKGMTTLLALAARRPAPDPLGRAGGPGLFTLQAR